MPIDFSPLVNAVARLDEGLVRYSGDTADSQIRDGLMQRFKVTYDLAHKFLRRTLEAASTNPDEVDRMTFPTLILTASELGLVQGDWPAWRNYRDMRSRAARACEEEDALPVVAAIPMFLREVGQLVERLRRNRHTTA